MRDQEIHFLKSGDSEGFFGPKKNQGRVAGKPQKKGEKKGGNYENPNVKRYGC